jgi:enoyl-CoA hydratase
MSWDIERIEGVAVVHMRPDPGEEKEWTFFRDLTDACDRLEHELPDCALVLTGGTRAFYGGMDYERALALFARGDVDEVRGWFARLSTTILRLFTLPRPTLAALNGDTLSLDMFTACACDFRIAVDDGARIGNTAVLHGVPLQSVFLELMKYAIGPAATSVIALSGRVFDPPAALAAGLVHRLAPAAELRECAVEWAQRLQSVPRPAYAATKHALQAETLDRMDRISAPLDTALIATLCSQANLEVQARALARLQRTPKPWRR